MPLLILHFHRNQRRLRQLLFFLYCVQNSSDRCIFLVPIEDDLIPFRESDDLRIHVRPRYGGKKNREKNDYIIEAQQAKIAELERRNAELTADNERQSRLLEKTTTELDEKQDQFADADAVLEAIADAA